MNSRAVALVTVEALTRVAIAVYSGADVLNYGLPWLCKLSYGLTSIYTKLYIDDSVHIH